MTWKRGEGNGTFKSLRRGSRALLAWERSSKHLECKFVQDRWAGCGEGV
jgi:hypothetical protein